MPHAAPQHADAQQQTWETLERLADNAARLSREDLQPSDFYQQLLGACVSALAAEGAVVWRFREGSWTLEQHVGLQQAEFAVPLAQPAHLELLASVARDGRPRVVLPTGAAGHVPSPGNPTGWMLILGPVSGDDSRNGVIEVLQRPTADAELQQAYANLLAALCEAAADFHRNRELRELRARQQVWEACDRFARQEHDGVGLRQVAYTIANEGRRLLACDRLSVARCRGRRCLLVSVSGVERIQRRSVTARCLERMSAVAAAMRETLAYDGSSADWPPELESLLSEYVEETEVRSLILQPLIEAPDEDADDPRRRQAPPVGVLIVEQFDARRNADGDGLLRTVGDHSRIALSAALRRRHWLARTVEWFRQGSRALKAGLAASLVLSAALAAAVVPADFSIQARGQLVPERRQDVFAPRDGEIQQLRVAHDDPVEPGQELARLTSADLTLELRRLRGEIETTQQKLRSIRAERVRASAPTAADRQAAASWSALEKELEKQEQSLRDQLAVVQAEEARLTLRSPIRGRIQTWDLQRLLEARPVRQGQVLMTVADVDGPWVLELEVPDHHIAHVTSARDEQQGKLEVTFILKTDPEAVYHGSVQRIGMTTVSDDRHQAHVQTVVAVERDQIRWLRSGASVVARIHCGRRPVGYVWLHDLIDAVRTWVLF